tara:strand:+ start:270 stop:494 length:225 start_codon:yes stop_codon:yes gene_type:complete
MEKITSYVRSENGKKIIIFTGLRDDFRCRQRSVMMNGQKVKPLKFISFKTMKKEIQRNNNKLIGTLNFNTISKL